MGQILRPHAPATARRHHSSSNSSDVLLRCLQVQDMYAAALAEDPNAFEYDALYESMQEQKAAPKQQERLARRPKYIASLLEQAEVRKKEQGITYERMLVRVGW